MRKCITGFILVLLFLQSQLPVFAQTYSCRYKVTATGLLPPGSPGMDDSTRSDSARRNNEFLGQLVSLIPIEVHVIYDIVTDGRYMIVNAKIDSLANNASGMNVESPDDEEAIIDIEKQLIFYTGSKQLKKMKLYTSEKLQTDTSGCSQHSITGKGAGSTITFCNDIPKCIFPTVIFNGMNMGVKSITTPNLSVRLSYFTEKQGGDKRLTGVAKYFSQHPVKGIEEGFLGN